MPYNDPEAVGELIAPTLQERSRRSLQRIQTAAEVILRRDGFDGFSVAAIAEVSGISIGGIYARVKGKPELYQLLKDAATRRLAKRIEARLQVASGGYTDVIDAFVGALVTEFSRDEKLHRALLMPGVVQEKAAMRSLERRRESIDKFVEALIKAEPALADLPPSRLQFSGNLVIDGIFSALGMQKTRVDWQDLSGSLRQATKSYLQSMLDNGALD
jgi:AcrR family transcriptional regulator